MRPVRRRLEGECRGVFQFKKFVLICPEDRKKRVSRLQRIAITNARARRACRCWACWLLGLAWLSVRGSGSSGGGARTPRGAGGAGGRTTSRGGIGSGSLLQFDPSHKSRTLSQGAQA